MREIVPIVFGLWVIFCVGLFLLRPGRDAAIVALVGGWALLPVAVYPYDVFDPSLGNGGSMLALAVSASPTLNRASVLGFGCLLGMILGDGPALRRFRFSRLDLPIATWCLIPIASALANGLPLAWGLAQARHLSLAWGVPYLLGRVYLGDNDSLTRFGRGWVIAGILSVPFCLLEFASQPFFNELVYGRNPYQIEGSARPFLYRPMLFAEHGNQLGMWVASVAVAACWLSRSGRLGTVLTIPGPLASAGLVALCLLCQSHGSIALMLAVLAGIWLLSRRTRVPRPAGWLAAALLALVVAPSFAEAAGFRDQVRNLFAGAGKGSFTWRLARYQDLLTPALAHPILGWGRPDWPPGPGHRIFCPVALGFWLFALANYGLIGLVASTLVFLLPVVEVLKWLPPRSWLNATCSGATLAAVLLTIHAADSLFNSVLILPVLAGAGGLNSWSINRYEAR